MQHLHQLAADEQLLAINLLSPSDARRASAVKRLAALLNDYSTSLLPSAQRVFLMGQLQSIERASQDIRFPTLKAERLA